MTAPASISEVHEVNERYHDLCAANYDAKWGIDYGARGYAQVSAKLAKAIGEPRFGPFARGLEIGAGTGYFGLNLALAGTLAQYTAMDISAGMLSELQATADRLGLAVATEHGDAAELPFDDESFDVVFGHAVLHHLPDLERALTEMRRVLVPGGVIAFCGEPSHYGDRIASVPKRAAYRAAPAWRRLMGAGPARFEGHHEMPEEGFLEAVVDVHAFTPAALAGAARAAGLAEVRVGGEELAASLFGWTNRALEATAEPSELPALWYRYAYHGYLAFQRLDRALLEPRLPAALFYNLLLSGRRA